MSRQSHAQRKLEVERVKRLSVWRASCAMGEHARRNYAERKKKLAWIDEAVRAFHREQEGEP